MIIVSLELMFNLGLGHLKMLMLENVHIKGIYNKYRIKCNYDKIFMSTFKD